MKKIFSTLFLGLVCTIGTKAQEYNLFYDVDADGWLWFDTDEKSTNMSVHAVLLPPDLQ